MKTAMQELIELLELNANNEPLPHLIDVIKEVYISKERHQIIHAFNYGENLSADYFNPERPEISPSVNYYIQMYGKQEIEKL